MTKASGSCWPAGSWRAKTGDWSQSRALDVSCLKFACMVRPVQLHFATVLCPMCIALNCCLKLTPFDIHTKVIARRREYQLQLRKLWLAKSYQDYIRNHWEWCFTHGLWSLGIKVLFLSVIRVDHYYRGGVEGIYSKEGALILSDIMWLLMGSGDDTFGIRPVNDFLVPMRKYPAVFQAKINVISEYSLDSQGLNY